MVDPFVVPPVPAVSPMEAAQLLREQGAVMIDVREPDEWATTRIPKAELKPMSTINEWYTDLPSDSTIIVQCRTGARSHAVVHALINQAGMRNVVNLEGGIVAWAEDELPLETSPPGG